MNLYPSTTDDLILEDLMSTEAADREYQASMDRGSEARAVAKAAVAETWDNPIAIDKALRGFELGKEEVAALAKLRRLMTTEEQKRAFHELTRFMDDVVEDYLFEREC